MKLIAIFILLLSIGTLASEDYLACIALALLGIGLYASSSKRKKKVALSTSDVDEYEAIIATRGELNKYYEYMENIQKYGKNDIGKSLSFVSRTIPILGQFVDSTKKSYGSFDISSIPAIDVGCRYWGALEDIDNLSILKSAIEQKKELKKWLPSIEAAFEDAALAGRIKKFLISNPGTLQNKLGNSLNISGRDTSRIIRTLENLGLVLREPEGKTYKLYLKQT